ncbi:unnamed protein product [Sphagnum balticum]
MLEHGRVDDAWVKASAAEARAKEGGGKSYEVKKTGDKRKSDNKGKAGEKKDRKQRDKNKRRSSGDWANDNPRERRERDRPQREPRGYGSADQNRLPVRHRSRPPPVVVVVASPADVPVESAETQSTNVTGTSSATVGKAVTAAKGTKSAPAVGKSGGAIAGATSSPATGISVTATEAASGEKVRSAISIFACWPLQK